MFHNTVKRSLREGKFQYGCQLGNFRSAEIPKLLRAAGFHWIFIDCEHGGYGWETIQDVCRMSNLVGLCPILRVADLQYSLIARGLDCGAQGILLPRVDSPELLAEAVSWCHYPPEGVRGYGLLPFHNEWAKASISEAMAHYNREVMVVVQIETVRGLEARDELLSVPGVDVLMVGPADLSIALGVPGDFQHPKMVEAMEAIRDSCLKHGVVPGTQTRSPELARFWKQRGMLFLGSGSETNMLYERAVQIVAALAED